MNLIYLIPLKTVEVSFLIQRIIKKCINRSKIAPKPNNGKILAFLITSVVSDNICTIQQTPTSNTKFEKRRHKTLNENEVVTFGNTSKVSNLEMIEEEEKHHD